MKSIKWKFIKSINTYEGTVQGDDEATISIHGSLCVTDVRDSRKSKVYVSPKHYKIIGLTLAEAKQLAEDLVSGDNFEIHEKNRLDWIEENNKSANTIKEATELLKSMGIDI